MRIVFQVALVLLTFFTVRAQGPADGQTWRYQLTEDAAIMSDCPICDRLSMWEPLRGNFNLIGTATPNRFIVTNIFFLSVRTDLPFTSIDGAGTLSFETGEPELTLDLIVFRGGNSEKIHMTNAAAELPRIFPMIGAQANESPGSLSRVYRLRVQAAPIRELWFSTTRDFTNSVTQEVFSQGDLLSDQGRVVRTNAELTELLTLPEGNVGLDAVDIGPRGEIFFSTTTNAESLVNGPISHGDIVTSAGRLYLQSGQLLSPFGVNDPEAGLDALHIESEDEIYFSITKDIPRTGAATLRRGDVLSNKGRIVKTEAALYLRWAPAGSGPKGLDALYIWPNGEVWFSPEIDFTAQDATPISAGDIISDQGYVVWRNAEVVRSFTPADAGNNFGLDALFVISDATASVAPTPFTAELSGAFVELRWESPAHVFQIESADKVEGPYLPASDIVPNTATFIEPLGPAQFYRIRQW